MISPGEECRSWDASRLAHTVWLCENDGRMGWRGSAGLQPVKAHVKGHLSAQGVWAEHLQLCFLILGCSKLSRKEKKVGEITSSYCYIVSEDFLLRLEIKQVVKLGGRCCCCCCCPVLVSCLRPQADEAMWKQSAHRWVGLLGCLNPSSALQNPPGVCWNPINHYKQDKYPDMPFLPCIPAKFAVVFPRMSNQYTELVKNSKFPEKSYYS